MNRNVEYVDLQIRPIRRGRNGGSKARRIKVATEVRPVGRVRIGNRILWEGTVSVITPGDPR